MTDNLERLIYKSIEELRENVVDLNKENLSFLNKEGFNSGILFFGGGFTINNGLKPWFSTYLCGFVEENNDNIFVNPYYLPAIQTENYKGLTFAFAYDLPISYFPDFLEEFVNYTHNLPEDKKEEVKFFFNKVKEENNVYLVASNAAHEAIHILQRKYLNFDDEFLLDLIKESEAYSTIAFSWKPKVRELKAAELLDSNKKYLLSKVHQLENKPYVVRNFMINLSQAIGLKIGLDLIQNGNRDIMINLLRNYSFIREESKKYFEEVYPALQDIFYSKNRELGYKKLEEFIKKL